MHTALMLTTAVMYANTHTSGLHRWRISGYFQNIPAARHSACTDAVWRYVSYLQVPRKPTIKFAGQHFIILA